MGSWAHGFSLRNNRHLTLCCSLLLQCSPLLFGIALKHRLKEPDVQSPSASPLPEWKVLASEQQKHLLNPATDMLEHFDQEGGFTFKKPNNI